MNSSAADAHERLMSNPEFWKMFLPLFFDEEKIREFATITGLSEERIRGARDKYLDRYVAKIRPYYHPGTGAIN
jgi:hypothetical protein